MTEFFDGHRLRLRLRAEDEGIEDFKTHELLEFLLCYSIPRKDVKELAHQLEERFGNISGVLNADVNSLLSVPGVGRRTADFFAALGEAVRAYQNSHWTDRPLLNNLYLLTPFLRKKFPSAPNQAEQTWQFLLSRDGYLLSGMMLCDSILWGEEEMIRRSLDHLLDAHAHSLLLVLVTPGRPGRPEPYDLVHLEPFSKMLSSMGIHMLDCVFVGTDVYSMHYSGDFTRSKTLNQASFALRETYLKEPDFPET